jgi:hypothetical protein
MNISTRLTSVMAVLSLLSANGSWCESWAKPSGFSLPANGALRVDSHTESGSQPGQPKAINPLALPNSGEKSGNISDRLGLKKTIPGARRPVLSPLMLMETELESDAVMEGARRSEQVQMSDLWEATLSRSPDIQFVMQKLMPNSDKGRTHTILSRLVSAALFGAAGASNLGNSPLTNMLTSSGANMLGRLLSEGDRRDLKTANVSEAEMIMLYVMVRGTAEKLVDSYREYKKTFFKMERANIDLQELQEMVAEGRSDQDSTKQVEMDYLLRKTKRDYNTIVDETRKYRMQVFDLAGADAVHKLDKQITDEFMQSELAMPVPTNKSDLGIAGSNRT